MTPCSTDADVLGTMSFTSLESDKTILILKKSVQY